MCPIVWAPDLRKTLSKAMGFFSGQWHGKGASEEGGGGGEEAPNLISHPAFVGTLFGMLTIV